MNEVMLFPNKGILNPLPIVEKEENQYKEEILFCAEHILSQKAKFVFLAGPSCSGKTTTALCLEKALLEKGKKVFAFSTDDFFFDQSIAPLNEDGTPNYDAFQHTDSDLILSVLKDFAKGNKTLLPTFDFLKGKRSEFREIDPEKYDVFLLEGIHALNDKIFLAAKELAPTIGFYLDVTRTISPEGKDVFLLPEDVRFIRRMIRDFKHRGASLSLTFSLWKNVRRAEREILHPFQKNAFHTISTSFSYEIPVEKAEVAPLLERVTKDEPLYEKANYLLSVLKEFPDLSEDIVPKNSVLREFID